MRIDFDLPEEMQDWDSEMLEVELLGAVFLTTRDGVTRRYINTKAGPVEFAAEVVA